MDKLTMAHEYAMKHLENSEGKITMHSLCLFAWQYADAMEAEADKRAKQKRAELREMLNHPNTFVEKEGQHFDDVEWQPDWSLAPKHMNYFFMDRNGSKFWTVNEPDKPNRTEHVMNFTDCGGDCYAHASDQDYTGDWRNSLRKRPEMEAERNG